jgi:hypothetical protein
MDNKNAIAATIGIGAIGSVLAYYGFNKLSDSPENKDQDTNFVVDGEGIGTTAEQNKGSMDEMREQVTKAIEETINTKIKTGDTNVSDKPQVNLWKDFWKGEYKVSNTTKSNE